jgi:putative transposase
MPTKITPFIYLDRFEVRYVSGNGGIRWNRDWVNVSTVCIGEYVGSTSGTCASRINMGN